MIAHSRDDAIQEGTEEYSGKPFWICEARPRDHQRVPKDLIVTLEHV
jgi:hypothetical protein